MPAPASYIDISSIPFSRLVTQAEFNVADEIWFRYIASGPIVLGYQTNSGGNFTPRTTVYQSDGSTIQKAAFTGTYGAWVYLTAGTYYIKIVKPLGGTTNFDFTFTADTEVIDVIGTLTAGDLIVNDDENLPALLMDNTGAIISFLSGIPGGEMGAILPSNVSFWHDFYGKYSAANHIAVFDASLNYIGSVNCNLIGGNKPLFAIDRANNKVYVKNQWDELWTISSAGVATNTGYSFPGDTPQIMAVSPDGSTLFWAARTADGIIHSLNLGTLTANADFYTIPGFVASSDTVGETPNNHPGDYFILDDNTHVLWWYDISALTYNLIHISSLGVLLTTKAFVDPNQLNHVAYINGDSAHVLIWYYSTSVLDTGAFGRLALATGVIDQNFSSQLMQDGVNMVGTTKFAPSTSCTLLRIQDTPAPTPSGTIIIRKVTNPSGLTQSFDFTSTGGLSPSTFSLNGDGDSRTFLSVPVGTYGITETAVSGYTTSYSVSSGDPHTAISVGDGDVITVTVTNQLDLVGGIYKIVPGSNKRNDTIYNSDYSTQNVAIPNPFGKSGLIGS